MDGVMCVVRCSEPNKEQNGKIYAVGPAKRESETPRRAVFYAFLKPHPDGRVQTTLPAPPTLPLQVPADKGEKHDRQADWERSSQHN